MYYHVKNASITKTIHFLPLTCTIGIVSALYCAFLKENQNQVLKGVGTDIPKEFLDQS